MNLSTLMRSPYIIGIAFIASLVALVMSTSLVIDKVRANADSVCWQVNTETTDLNGICANGAWGEWDVTGQQDDHIKCVTATTKQRTYTGTRLVKLIQQFWTSYQCNTSNGRGGRNNTQSVSSACQVTETEISRTLFSKEKAATVPGCLTKITDPDTKDKITTPDPTTTTTTTAVDITGGDMSTDVTGQEGILFDASKVNATLTAKPLLVRPGTMSVITWASEATKSCAVTGSNGDSWTGISGQRSTSSITGEVRYTLRCTVLNDSQLERQVTVSIIPNWREK